MNKLDKAVLEMQKQYHKTIYVNYKKEAIKSKLHKEDLLEKIDWLISNDYKFIKHSTLRKVIKPKTYCLTMNDHLINLSYYDGKNYYWYSTNYHDDVKNVETPNSFRDFKNMFKKRTNKRMSEVFGKTKQNFKLYCPKPLYYSNDDFIRGKWFKGICKEDYISHYPASALGLLPDASTMVLVSGDVKPSKEFEFAFYPDSGNIAIYGEFDTREYLSFVNKYSAKVKKSLYSPNYGAKDTKTILMKSSKYSLKEEIMYFFNIKDNFAKDTEDYYTAKIFLLKFIGMLEQCSPMIYAGYPYAHLAAVIKWRSNIKLFNDIKKIGSKKIVQVCVDGIIHAGEPIGKKEGSIGTLVTEISNAKFVQRGINQYIIKNDIIEERKHAGLDINTGSNIIMNWRASPKVDFKTYMLDNYEIEVKKYEEEDD